jgi:hypothetical protein
VQRFERKPRHFDRCELRRPRFSHPGRQQPPRAIRVVDNKVRAAPVLQSANHADAFTRARVVGVVNENFERLFLGSISRA